MAALPSKEQIAYMIAHSDESLVPNIIICVSICGIASIVFILLRLYSQYLVSHKFRLTQSDILLLIAWVFYVVYSIGLGMITKYGGGRHVIMVTDMRLLNIWKIIDEVSYTASLGFLKLGIIRLYGSIFRSRTFHRFLWVFALLIIAFHIAISIVNILECIPIQYYWDVTISVGYCLNYGLFMLLVGIINVIIDFILVFCPIPMVLRLHTSKQKKRLLIFTFCMGGSACIVSIVRLAFSLDFDATGDPSYDNIRLSLLSLIELVAGILDTSIPTYWPLFRHITAICSPSLINSSANIDSKDSKWNSGGSIRTSPQITADVSSGQLESNISGINVTTHVELARYTNMGGNWIRVPDDIHKGWK
ncbi:hypothetical protein F5Y00DRAFT_269388 [Daldinia vernicosa]|uniref:uncharacterized protein n=1 Tax=Daldinia vernicosa TaxID=114800 RepID=UPI002008C4ED|nr:uncharacterized protein F5Y00DRAFT_269388 [Daldinia vernicosa]KAI0849403.1 hypothetical protein F5Y00DRAFT_269388 [Daldinia vernicosa]